MNMRIVASIVLAVIILVCVGWFAYNRSTGQQNNVPPPPPPEVRAAIRAEIERRIQAGTLARPTSTQAIQNGINTASLKPLQK